MILDIFKLDRVFKALNIDEVNFKIKDDSDNENASFYYCNLDDEEFQFGEDGSIATNYPTKYENEIIKQTLAFDDVNDDELITPIAAGTYVQLLDAELDTEYNSGVAVRVRILDKDCPLFNAVIRIDAGLIVNQVE